MINVLYSLEWDSELEYKQSFLFIIALRSKTVAHNFFYLSIMQMAVSVKIQKFCYHGNLTSHFSSLLRRADLLIIFAKYSGVLKNVYKDEWCTYVFCFSREHSG